MSRIVAFLRRHVLLRPTSVFALWPVAFYAFHAIRFDLQQERGYALSPTGVGSSVAASALMLCLIVALRSLWRQRRWVAAAVLATLLIVPYLTVYTWIVEMYLEKWRLQALHDRVRKDKQVLVSELDSDWDRVCACSYVDSDFGCLAGYGKVRRYWQLKFYRDSSSAPPPDNHFAALLMPEMAIISHDRTRCFTRDQEPVISRDPLHGDLLTLMPRPSPSGAPK